MARTLAETVIDAIRTKGPDNLIVLGTLTWSQKVDVASYNPTNRSNIAYTLHFYAASHKASLRQRATTVLNNGIALFVTEWGAYKAGGNGFVDQTSSKEWRSFINQKQLSASCRRLIYGVMVKIWVFKTIPFQPIGNIKSA